MGCCYVAIAALLTLAPCLNAQVLYGSLNGNVADTTGRSVPNARIEALNVATGIARQATTDDRGGFLISDLQQGIYYVNAEIRPAQITERPTNSNATRNFQSVFLIVPGYTPPASEHSEAGNPQAALGANGNGASYNNNTRIDGVSDLYPRLPESVAYVPAAEAIQTVNVVTASFDAEQGMAGGSVVNVTITSASNERQLPFALRLSF
jgi:hypothetical protein